MNARELIDSLAALPGVRPVSTATRGIEKGALVNGIELPAPLTRKSARCARPGGVARTAGRRRSSLSPTRQAMSQPAASSSRSAR